MREIYIWLAISLLQRSHSTLARTHNPITPVDCFSQYTAVAFSSRLLTVLAPLSVMCLQVSLKVQYKLYDISGGIYRFRLQGPCSIQTITLYTIVDLACNMRICCGDHRIKASVAMHDGFSQNTPSCESKKIPYSPCSGD